MSQIVRVAMNDPGGFIRACHDVFRDVGGEAGEHVPLGGAVLPRTGRGDGFLGVPTGRKPGQHEWTEPRSEGRPQTVPAVVAGRLPGQGAQPARAGFVVPEGRDRARRPIWNREVLAVAGAP